MTNKCELCDLVNDGQTQAYRNSICTIVEDEDLFCPKVVFNHHGKATQDEARKAEAVIDCLYDYDCIDKIPKRARKHEHWYIIGAILIDKPD